MSSVAKVTVVSMGTSVCALTQREAEGLMVSFEDGTVKEQFLSWRAFRQLLGMRVPKMAKPATPAAPPMSPAPANGAPAQK